jgi:predicted ATPase
VSPDIPSALASPRSPGPTEAGQAAQAVPYWQRTGQLAIERSANVEAISHLTKGLEVLKTLPDTPETCTLESRQCLHASVQ